jgi:hypothetical protein
VLPFYHRRDHGHQERRAAMAEMDRNRFRVKQPAL